MRRLLLVSVLLPLPALWCAAAPAPESRRTKAADEAPSGPMIVVKSPKQTIAGNLVKLDASQSNVDSLEWHLVDGSTDDFDVCDAGKRATFSSPKPGAYFFSIAGAKLVDGKAVAVGSVVKVELVSDPDKPAKPDDPVLIPPVKPTPNLPPFVAWVQKTAQEQVTGDPNRAQTAKALAAAYRAWSQGPGANVSSAQTYVTGSNKLLDLLLTQSGRQESWKPFRDALDAHLSQYSLTTVKQHVQTWEEIARGLELVN